MIESPIAIDTNYVIPIVIVTTVFHMNYALKLKKHSLSLLLVSLTSYMPLIWSVEGPFLYAYNGVPQNAPLYLPVHTTLCVNKSQLVSL